MELFGKTGSRWARILVVVTLLGIAGAAYLWYFGEQTFWVLGSRYIGWKVPLVNETPRGLEDNSVSNNPGVALSYFGYQFEIPWNDIDPLSTKVTGSRVVLHFRSGLSLAFLSSEPKAFVKEFLSHGDYRTNRQIYGDDALQSDYALTRLMLESTPRNITLLTPEKDAVRLNMLLVTKAIATPNADSGIFSIRTEEFHGFQYEDPRSHPKRILVDLFADDGGLEFIFSREDKQPVIISQSDINRVLRTLRRIDQKRKAAAVAGGR